MKSIPSQKSPTMMLTTIHAIHPQMVMNKLKPIKDDFLSYVQSNASVSSLSVCVNDSAAGDTTFADCYEKQDVLGEGGFAIVYRCRHLERGHHYAVKEVFHQNDYHVYDQGVACRQHHESDENTIKQELESLRRLRDGPYIVRLLDVFREPTKTYMIMEEMRGGDLLARLYEKEVFSEGDAKKVSRKLLEAVAYCHKKNIAHRDIKPENILLVSPHSDTDIKLGDFGCSKSFNSDHAEPKNLFTLCGSPQYVAPELYMHENGYDERCDLWSAAVVIYVLLGGYAPFDGEDRELPTLICEGYVEFHPKYWNNISQPPKDLIKSLLVVDPEERATIVDALDSEWLRRRDKESLDSYLNNGESKSTFDAWVRLQNESLSSTSHHQLLNFDEMDDDEEQEEEGVVKAVEDDDDDHEEEEEYYDDSDEDDDDSSCRSLSIEDL